MNTGSSAFLLAALAVGVAYLMWEHKRANTPTDIKPPPGTLDETISASMTPGDLVGPGATANSGWYVPQPPRVINLMP